MKLSIARDSLVTLALASTLVDAKQSYFSKGWQPGQEVRMVARPQHTQVYGKDPSGAWKLSDLPIAQKVEDVVEDLVSEPEPVKKKPSFAVALTETLTKATGFNFTGAYERAQAAEKYDPAKDVEDGFVRLTDLNYEETVTYEHLPDEYGVTQEDRVWFFIIHGPERDVASKWFGEAMTNATRIARENKEDPMRNVKWGRLAYMDEVEMTARWLIFKPPVLVVATNRGRDLRFIKPGMVAPDGAVLERFMREEKWKNFPVWESKWGPGGSRAWVVNTYIAGNKLWSSWTANVPNWVLLIMFSMFTQQLLAFMHSGDKKPAVKPAVVSPKQVVGPTPSVADDKLSAKASDDTVKVEVKRRKGKK